MGIEKLMFASTAAVVLAYASSGSAQSIMLSTTRSLTFAGFTTSPLTQVEQQSFNTIYKPTTIVPPHVREKLGVAVDNHLTFLNPGDEGYFWFKNEAAIGEVSIGAMNKDGWYGFTRETVAFPNITVYSLPNVPKSSNEFTLHIFKGRFSGSHLLDKFVIKNSYHLGNSHEPTEPTQYPITKSHGEYRLTIKQVAGGVASLQSRHKQEGRNTKEDVFNPDLIPAKMPQMPYSSILWELSKKSEVTGLRGALETALGDGFDPVKGDWKAYAKVTDSHGQVWSTDFAGSRSGWGDTEYMESPVNLPDSEGPLNFDLYLVDQKESTMEFTSVATFAVPGDRQALDEFTTTVQGARLQVGIVGSMHKVPPQISQGAFEGQLAYVDSLDPVPEIEMRVQTADGSTVINDGYNPDTHNDEIHRSIFTFGSADPKSKDYIKLGTSATLSIRIPQHLHFHFKATPLRPNSSR